MATIQQNTINFTNVQADPIFMVGGKFSKSDNNDGTAHFDTTLSENEIGKSFNALEIDWNGANISSAINSIDSTTHHNCLPEGINTINTTGELLKVIANLQAEFNKLYDDVHPPVTYSVSFDVVPEDKQDCFYIYGLPNPEEGIIPGKTVRIYNTLGPKYNRSNIESVEVIKLQSGESVEVHWHNNTTTRFSFTMPEEDVNIIIGITEPESYDDGTGNLDPIPLKKYSIELDSTYLRVIEGLSRENFHITANNGEITSEGIASGYTVRIYLIDTEEYTNDDIIISSDQVANIAFNSELNCWEFEMPSQSVRLLVSKSYNGGVGGNDEPDPDPEPGPTPITYELDFAFNEPLSPGDFNIITNSINTIANGPINIQPDIIVSIYSTNDNYNSENINIISTSEDTEVTWLDDHWEFSMPASNITIGFDKKSNTYDGGI